MMMPMEDIPSPQGSTEESTEEKQNVVPENGNRCNSNNGCLKLKNLFCCSCSGQDQSGISRNKIEPVICQPINDVYLQLKPNRRIRVIHINGLGALPITNPYYLTHSASDSDDDEEYWFENADPKRPKITQPPVKNVPKRIFHKLEPQVRPTLEQLSPSNLFNSSIQGRLPRKTIDKDAANASDDDEDDEQEDDSKKTPGSAENSPASLKKNINIKSGKPDLSDVITLPEPGESSTDDDCQVDGVGCPNDDHDHDSIFEGAGITASIEEAGQKLGGMANVAFESEEDTPDVSIKVSSQAKENVVPHGDAKAEENGKPVFVLPALFFIHGVGGSANVWSSQLSYFSNLGHEVIAPDILGHGFSSAPDKAKSYTFSKLLRDLLTIFDHFVPRTRECIVIGHSYGCSMAAALTKSRPESVKLLVMCSSGGPTPLSPPTQLSKIPPACLACIKPLLKCHFGSSQKYKPRGKSTKIQQVFDVPSYVLHHIMMGQDWPEGDASYHRKITIPTLLTYGIKDTLVSLVEMCEMERTLPKAYLELIPLAGHMLMQDQPDKLNAMLKKFISRYCSPSI